MTTSARRSPTVSSRAAAASSGCRRGARSPDGIFADGATLYVADDGAVKPYASLAGIGSLRGEHNAQNAAAAVAAVRLLGISDEAIVAGLRTFRGLPHRMEEVGRRGRVLFVNDSKATNADAAAKALRSFDRIYWIAGGRAKEGGIDSLADYFPRIAKAYLIGEATEPFAATLAPTVPVETVGDAGCRARLGGARCSARPGSGAGGAAVAGLRVL